MSLRIVLTILLLAGCATGPHPPAMTDDAYPGVLVDSTVLPSGLFLRQRIDARFGERTMSFSAVLQVDAGVLSLLALTPYGTRAFLIEQAGQAVRFTRYVDRELPFPPRFILLDVHRALFSGVVEAAPPPDGTRAYERHGERVTERWQAGKLLERSFERLDHKPAGTILVRYGPAGLVPNAPPARIELDNGWFDYQLVIETLESD
jgi:hypothetical protein